MTIFFVTKQEVVASAKKKQSSKTRMKPKISDMTGFFCKLHDVFSEDVNFLCKKLRVENTETGELTTVLYLH